MLFPSGMQQLQELLPSLQEIGPVSNIVNWFKIHSRLRAAFIILTQRDVTLAPCLRSSSATRSNFRLSKCHAQPRPVAAKSSGRPALIDFQARVRAVIQQTHHQQQTRARHHVRAGCVPFGSDAAVRVRTEFEQQLGHFQIAPHGSHVQRASRDGPGR